MADLHTNCTVSAAAGLYGYTATETRRIGLCTRSPSEQSPYSRSLTYSSSSVCGQ